MIFRIALLLIFLCPPGGTLMLAQPSTKGTEFWVAFLENIDLAFNGTPQFSFLISSDYNASETIVVPVTGRC